MAGIKKIQTAFFAALVVVLLMGAGVLLTACGGGNGGPSTSTKNFFGITPDNFSVDKTGYTEWDWNSYRYDDITQFFEDNGYINFNSWDGQGDNDPATVVFTYGGCYYLQVWDGEYTHNAVYSPSINNAVSLAVGASKTLSNDTMFKFKCTESGTYAFSSYGNDNCDPYAYLFDSAKNYVGQDDDNGNNGNFLLAADLEAGQTYYLLATTWDTVVWNGDGFDGGSYSVTLADLSSFANQFGIAAPDQFDFYNYNNMEWYWYNNCYYDEICQCLENKGFMSFNAGVWDDNSSAYTYVSICSGGYYMDAYDGQYEHEVYFVPGMTDEVALAIGISQEVSQNTWFQFDCTESGLYEFYSCDNNCDPYAYLFDSDLNYICEDDDNGGNGDFMITTNLEAGQTYYLFATTYDGFYGGSYEIMADRIVPTSLAAETPQTIAQGTWFQFDCTESGMYAFFSANNDSCDPYACLYDSDFNYIDADDDNGGNYNFSITAYLEAGSTYYLYATTCDSYFYGDSYDVSVQNVTDITNLFGITPDEFGYRGDQNYYWLWYSDVTDQIAEYLTNNGYELTDTEVISSDWNTYTDMDFNDGHYTLYFHDGFGDGGTGDITMYIYTLSF